MESNNRPKRQFTPRRGNSVRPKQEFYAVYLHIQLDGFLLSANSIMLVTDETEIKGQMYLDNYSVRVMNKVPVKEKYPDFNPSKPVYKDLIADGKAMKKRLNNLSQLVNPNFQVQE